MAGGYGGKAVRKQVTGARQGRRRKGEKGKRGKGEKGKRGKGEKGKTVGDMYKASRHTGGNGNKIATVLFNEGYPAILKIMNGLDIKIGPQCKQYSGSSSKTLNAFFSNRLFSNWWQR